MDHRTETDPLSEAPLLRSIPKVDPFVVPEGFFEQFPHQVQAAIAKKKAASWWSRLLPSTPAFRVAWASAAVLVAALAWFNRPSAPETAPESPLASSDDEWVLVDNDLLAELAAESNRPPGVQHDLTADELADYLMASNAMDYITELQ
ncbi:MAG: hypothetical protein WAT74_02745 [Flavobacteriales bacterium]